MGIGTDTADAAIATIKAATPNRTNRRKQIAAAKDRLDKWLARFDARENAAPADFAASRTSQFNTFVDALPDIVLDAEPN